MPSVARYYANVNVHKTPDQIDYEKYEIEWGLVHAFGRDVMLNRNQDEYIVFKKIGHGKYSEVYEGENITSHQRCVVKILKPTKMLKIKREVMILRHLQEGPNVVKLLDTVRDEPTRTPSFVFEYLNNVDDEDVYPIMPDADIRRYALEYAHSHGVIHRDVKPGNIAYDPVTKQMRLLDWGLADYYLPGKNYNCRVASLYYKGPELLLGYEFYDYSLDIWAVFRSEPFFWGDDNVDQVVKIGEVLGSAGMNAYITKYGINVPPAVNAVIKQWDRKPFTAFITDTNRQLATEDALDLIDKMLRYDHNACFIVTTVVLIYCTGTDICTRGYAA